MTKKDYIVISNIIRSIYKQSLEEASYDKIRSSNSVYFKVRETITNIVVALADHFEKDNPNFNRDKFELACYWTKEDYKKQLELAGTKEVA